MNNDQNLDCIFQNNSFFKYMFSATGNLFFIYKKIIFNDLCKGFLFKEGKLNHLKNSSLPAVDLLSGTRMAPSPIIIL